MTTKILGVGATDIVSGAERVLLHYGRAALDAGMDFSVASPDGPLAQALAKEGIPHSTLPDLKLGEGSKAAAVTGLAGRNLKAVLGLRRRCRGADLVIVNSLMALPAVVAARPSAPIHWLVHDVVTRGDLRRLVKLSSGGIDGAIAVSEAAAVFPRGLGIPTIVVRNGVTFSDQKIHPPASPPIVGLSGVLTPWKGQDVFLEALGLLQQPFRAQLLGGALPKDDSYETDLRSRASQPDLAGRVQFLGHSESPVEVMRSWSIAVSASTEPEAGPLVVAEAMSLGLAIVVTNHGGAPETLDDCGLSVPPNDPRALAEAIDSYLAHPERRAVDGDRARQRAEDLFRIEDAAERFLTVARGLAHGDTAPGAES